jgi:hypothetical protein
MQILPAEINKKLTRNDSSPDSVTNVASIYVIKKIQTDTSYMVFFRIPKQYHMQ